MGLRSWFSLSKEERRAAREQRKRRQRADAGIRGLLHSSPSEFESVKCEAIRELLEHGGNVDAAGEQPGCEGYTLLHIAATVGRSDIASLVVESGADINALPGLGGSPLMIAATMGHVDIVRQLLEAGAVARASDLQLAKKMNNDQVVELLESWHKLD